MSSNPSTPAISGSTDEIEAKLLELWEKYSYQPETVEELFHPELNRKFRK